MHTGLAVPTMDVDAYVPAGHRSRMGLDGGAAVVGVELGWQDG